jgi:hypothetical protein
MKVMAARGKEVDFAVWRLHHPEYTEVRRLALSDCGHAVCLRVGDYFVGLGNEGHHRQRRSKRADALIAGAYFAGTSTRPAAPRGRTRSAGFGARQGAIGTLGMAVRSPFEAKASELRAAFLAELAAVEDRIRRISL